MSETSSILDQEVVDALKRFPTAELVALLFPGHPVPTRRRGLIRSPFREDRNPSFSCFSGRGGYSFWRDHTTEESGDNIDLFRKVYPDLGYVEAVNRLALLVLGRQASCADVRTLERTAPLRRVPFSHTIEPERESVLKVVSDKALDGDDVPSVLRDYWRGRGISDRVIVGMGLRYIIFENSNRKGMTLRDPDTGLPFLDRDGNELKDDGRNEAIGMYNDIGGVILRVPETATHRGFKTSTTSFIATFLADDSRPAKTVRFAGKGDNVISRLVYDQAHSTLFINPTQAFTGVGGVAAAGVHPLLEDLLGSTLSMREVRNVAAVLNALNAPAAGECVVVEGMFDALSERELNRAGRGRDLVVANSVGNLRWAVPFICRHARVHLMLDHDAVSRTGQKASANLCGEIAEYCRRTGVQTVVFDASSLYEGYKDLNEALMAGKGFPVVRQDKGDAARVAQSRKDSNVKL